MVPDKPFGSARDAGEALARHGVPAQQGTLLGCSLAWGGARARKTWKCISLSRYSNSFSPTSPTWEKDVPGYIARARVAKGKDETPRPTVTLLDLGSPVWPLYRGKSFFRRISFWTRDKLAFEGLPNPGLEALMARADCLSILLAQRISCVRLVWLGM